MDAPVIAPATDRPVPYIAVGGFPTCPGNANGDTFVNIDYLVSVITHWGACP